MADECTGAASGASTTMGRARRRLRLPAAARADRAGAAGRARDLASAGPRAGHRPDHARAHRRPAGVAAGRRPARGQRHAASTRPGCSAAASRAAAGSRSSCSSGSGPDRFDALVHPGQKLKPGALVVLEGDPDPDGTPSPRLYGRIEGRGSFGRRTLRFWTALRAQLRAQVRARRRAAIAESTI